MELTYFNLLETLKCKIFCDYIDVTLEKAEFQDEQGKLHVRYQVVTYDFGDSTSETFKTKKEALKAYNIELDKHKALEDFYATL